MRKFIVSSAVSVIFCSPFLGAETKVPIKQKNTWSDANFSWDAFLLNMTPENCYESEILLKRCYFAANRLLEIVEIRKNETSSTASAADMTVRFIPDKIKEVEELTEVKTLRSFGKWKVVQVKEKSVDKLPSGEQLKRLRRIKVERAKALEELSKVEQKDRTPFADFFSWVKEYYQLKDPKAINEAVAEATNAAIEVEDPHGGFVPNEMATDLKGTSKEIHGIGFLLYSKPGSSKIVVREVSPAGPAEKAGLKRGDQILSVQNQPVDKNTSIDDLSDLLHGEKGTSVKIEVHRQNVKHIFHPIRDRVIANAIYSEIISSSSTAPLLLLRFSNFPKGICKELAKTYAEKKRTVSRFDKTPPLSGVILDLRGNTGGFLGEAACVIGLFIKDENVAVRSVSVDDRMPPIDIYPDLKSNGLTDADAISEPVVVLANSRSASAAEVVTGSLQFYSSTDEPEFSTLRHHRGLVIGTRTFGKGSSQAYIMRNPNATHPFIKNLALLNVNYVMTAGYYSLPNNFFVELRGITPDIETYWKPNLTEDEKVYPREEDEFENSLPARGQNYSRTKEWQEFIDQIQSCMKSSNETPEQTFDRLTKSDDPFADYQVITAQAAIACMK
jgi:carboxyl-terminal processing protease